MLHDKTVALLNKALSEIRQARPNALKAMQDRFYVGEYLLTEAKEYVDASWDLLKAGKARASQCVSRWILEAALNLLWVNAETDQVDHRLKLLEAEALRLWGARLEGLADLNPDPKQAAQLRDQAATVRDNQRTLVPQTNRGLRSLDFRIKSIMKYLGAKSVPNPYALYRDCCARAHPGLELWRRLSYAPGGAMVTSKPPDEVELARYMAAAATMTLVGEVYGLTKMRDKDVTAWWEDQVVPLL